jgi:hypothetical protein
LRNSWSIPLILKREMPGEIPLTTKDNIFARAGEYQAARPMNPGVKFAREVDGAEEFYDLDRSLFFGLDTGIQRAILEVVSKPHLRPNGCVAGLFRWLIPPAAGLRFLDRPAPCP